LMAGLDAGYRDQTGEGGAGGCFRAVGDVNEQRPHE
jgi:hypothetical protein